MRVNKFTIGGIGLGVLGLLTAAACGSTSTPSTSTLASAQVLHFPVFQDPGTFDPGEITAEVDSELMQNVFDNLWRFDNNLNIVPDIATAVPTQANGGISADGLTYTVHLNPAAKFSNGDAVTSKDVLYSWNRAAALQGGYASILAKIQGYSAVQKAAGAPPTSGTPTTFQGNIETQLKAGNPAFMMSGLTAIDPETVQIKLSASVRLVPHRVDTREHRRRDRRSEGHRGTRRRSRELVADARRISSAPVPTSSPPTSPSNR